MIEFKLSLSISLSLSFHSTGKWAFLENVHDDDVTPTHSNNKLVKAYYLFISIILLTMKYAYVCVCLMSITRFESFFSSFSRSLLDFLLNMQMMV